MLDHRSGPQIGAKCKQLVVAAGSFPAGPPDSTIKSDVAAARRLFAEWPTSIVAVDRRRRASVPAASIDKDFARAPVHPVVDAYRAFKPMPYDASASAPAAVLHAVHPDDGTSSCPTRARSRSWTMGGRGLRPRPRGSIDI